MPEDPSPTVRPVRFPADYGTPGGQGSYIEWAHVEERLHSASNYWLTTVTPEGRPHARPVDGVWLQGALIFGGSPDTRWVRNLTANPKASVHLSSEAEAIILEGHAALITDPDHLLAKPSADASRLKYPQYYTDADPNAAIPFDPFWLFRPTIVLAWTLEGFPKNATRWRFPTKE